MGITMLLLMDESQMKTLPAESRETAQSFRKMYTEEKELKAQGPEAILKHGEKRAAEAADLRRRTKNVNEALDEVAVDTSKGALRLERAKDKSLKKKERARRKDRKDQLQKMRALASATS